MISWINKGMLEKDSITINSIIVNWEVLNVLFKNGIIVTPIWIKIPNINEIINNRTKGKTNIV